MGGVKVYRGEFGFRSINPHGLHEAEGFIDFPRKETVARPCFGFFDKVQIPRVQSRNVGKAPGTKGSQDIERLGTLIIRIDHALGVISSGFGCKLFAVHIVPPITGQRNSINLFIRFTPRFGELTRHPSNLDDGHGTSKGHDECHLHNDPERIADVIDVEFLEGFGAVASHEDESLALADSRQFFVEGTDLAREY